MNASGGKGRLRRRCFVERGHLVAASLLLLPGCGAEPGGEALAPSRTVEWTDSLPVVDLTNHEGVAIRLPPAQDLARGGAPRGALRLSPDSLLVWEHGTSMHLVSLASSDILRSRPFALRGDGWIVRGRDGEVLAPLAGDAILRVSSQLEVIDTLVSEGALIGSLYDGDLVLLNAKPARGDRSAGRGVRTETVEVGVLRLDGSVATPLFRGIREVGGSLSQVWSAAVLAASSRCDVWVSPDAGSELLRFDSQGNPSLRLTGVPGPEDEMAMSLDDWVGGIQSRLNAREDSGFSTETIQRQLDQVEPWRDLRTIVGLRVTETGTVWVSPVPALFPFVPDRSTWIGFDREGKGVGTVVIPGHHRVLAIQDTHIVTTDIRDSRMVYLHELPWGEPVGGRALPTCDLEPG